MQSVIDLLFPPRETELIIRDITAEQIESFLSPATKDGIITLTQYQNPLIQALVKENKYHGNTLACAILAKVLDSWLLQQTPANIFLVPIPLGRKRQRERGYNQIIRILETLPPRPCIHTWIPLTRSLETVPQTSLKRSDRLRNMAGAFSFIPTSINNLEGSTVVIIDDVTTTGATLRAARAVLQPNLPPSCKLLCVALAH